MGGQCWANHGADMSRIESVFSTTKFDGRRLFAGLATVIVIIGYPNFARASESGGHPNLPLALDKPTPKTEGTRDPLKKLALPAAAHFSQTGQSPAKVGSQPLTAGTSSGAEHESASEESAAEEET